MDLLVRHEGHMTTNVRGSGLDGAGHGSVPRGQPTYAPDLSSVISG